MRQRLRIALLSGYAAMAIATFGHAAAQDRARTEAEYTECRVRSDYCPRFDMAEGVGLVAAIAWPLYWSWEIWE